MKAEINAMSMQIGIQTQRPDNLTFLWTEVAMRGSSNTIAFLGATCSLRAMFFSAEVCKWGQTCASIGVQINHAAVLKRWFHADLTF